MTRVRICDALVLKRYGDATLAQHVLARANAVRAVQVRSPGCRQTRSGRTLVFERIAGSAGLKAIQETGALALRPLMAQALALHSASLDALELPRHDPLAKILPRMDADTETAYRGFVAGALQEIDEASPTDGAPVHGDLHAGQFIVDSGGAAWLLDLDDLAIGPAEADLGNFAAHLATRPETAAGRPLEALRRWCLLVGDAYLAEGGRAVAPLIDAYGRIALVRRALKLAGRGDRLTDERLRAEIGAAT